MYSRNNFLYYTFGVRSILISKNMKIEVGHRFEVVGADVQSVKFYSQLANSETRMIATEI